MRLRASSWLFIGYFLAVLGTTFTSVSLIFGIVSFIGGALFGWNFCEFRKLENDYQKHEEN